MLGNFHGWKVSQKNIYKYKYLADLTKQPGYVLTWRAGDKP